MIRPQINTHVHVVWLFRVVSINKKPRDRSQKRTNTRVAPRSGPYRAESANQLDFGLQKMVANIANKPM